MSSVELSWSAEIARLMGLPETEIPSEVVLYDAHGNPVQVAVAKPAKPQRQKAAKPKAETNPDRSDAARRAWVTIRAKRAAAAAGQPVPETKKSAGTGQKAETIARISSGLDAWLSDEESPETEAIPEAPVIEAEVIPEAIPEVLPEAIPIEPEQEDHELAAAEYVFDSIPMMPPASASVLDSILAAA